MTEKELRRLSRADLLEMLIEQSAELHKVRKKCRLLEQKMESRQIAIDEAGSIAEAALRINGVFEAAQASCEQYMENIRALSERQEMICQQREQESIQKASDMLTTTVRHCADLEAETKEKCERMLKQARAEAERIRQGMPPQTEIPAAPAMERIDLTEPPRRRIRRGEKEKADT